MAISDQGFAVALHRSCRWFPRTEHGRLIGRFVVEDRDHARQRSRTCALSRIWPDLGQAVR